MRSFFKLLIIINRHQLGMYINNRRRSRKNLVFGYVIDERHFLKIHRKIDYKTKVIALVKKLFITFWVYATLKTY